jgi:hypothetical protein
MMEKTLTAAATTGAAAVERIEALANQLRADGFGNGIVARAERSKQDGTYSVQVCGKEPPPKR